MKEVVRAKLLDCPTVREILDGMQYRTHSSAWYPGMPIEPEPTGRIHIELSVDDARLRELVSLDCDQIANPDSPWILGQWNIVRRFSRSELLGTELFVALPERYESPEHLVLGTRASLQQQQAWRTFDASDAELDYTLTRVAARRDVLHTAGGFTLVSERVRRMLARQCPNDVRFAHVRGIPQVHGGRWNFNESAAGRELLRLYAASGSAAPSEFWRWVEEEAPTPIREQFFSEAHRLAAARISRAKAVTGSHWRMTAEYDHAHVDQGCTLFGSGLCKRVLGVECAGHSEAGVLAERDTLGRRLLSRVAIQRNSLSGAAIEATVERFGAIEQEIQARRMLLMRPELVRALEAEGIRGFVFEPCSLT